MISKEHREYLLSRSYVEALLKKEDIRSLPEGHLFLEGCELDNSGPVVAWVCRSLSGALTGIQTRRIDEHEYRWSQAPKAQHLPILYGTDEDHDLLYQTGRVIITEGIFDRAALKRCVPDYAVYARLSKGIAKSLTYLLLRYAKLVWTAFDQDGPGQKATEETKEKLGSKVRVHHLLLPAKDPSKLIETRGEGRTREIVERQIRSMESL